MGTEELWEMEVFGATVHLSLKSPRSSTLGVGTFPVVYLRFSVFADLRKQTRARFSLGR